MINIINIIDINSDGIITMKFSNYLYLYNDFTLTVNAVNDAPVLLQSLESLEIVEDSGAASVVLYTILGGLVHPIFNLL